MAVQKMTGVMHGKVLQYSNFRRKRAKVLYWAKGVYILIAKEVHFMRCFKMKRKIIGFLIVVFVVGVSACAKQDVLPQRGADIAALPGEPLVTDIYTADPSAHVFDGTLYIYPSHDPNSLIDPAASSDKGGQYQMVDYHVLSLDNETGTFIDHGATLKLEDIPWASWQLWAPDAAYKNGLYYLYFPAKDKDGIFRIGVATSKSPVGPFAAQEDYIEGSYSMDPCVFTDTDGESYMIFGGLDGGQLEHWQTGEYVEQPKALGKSDPALGPRIAKMSDDMLGFAQTPQAIEIVDANGDPILARDEYRRFFEAAWVHRYQGKYYLSYSTGTTHFLVYAISDTIEGPYVYQGQILNPVVGWTTHHSIVEYNDAWYLFYHDATLSNGVDYQRCVKYQKLNYLQDGTIEKIDSSSAK